MAASATDVLSVAEFRTQLQIDDDVPESRILPVIESSVNLVSEYTGIVLIDRDQTFSIYPDDDDKPIVIPAVDVKSVVSIIYWGTDQQLREVPTGRIDDLSTLGRISLLDDNPASFKTAVWPPSDGWPDILTDSYFLVTVNIGFDITSTSASLKHAVILMARLLYEQDLPERSMSDDFSVTALLAPWRRWPKVMVDR